MLGRILLAFAFYYPLSMAWLWIFGALNYYLRRERKSPPRTQPPKLDEWPKATLVVPCHNEGENVRDTLEYLAAQDIPTSRSSPSTMAAAITPEAFWMN
jgi:biofilm PGA synthesis N-glycosyltransferase PgaC